VPFDELIRRFIDMIKAAFWVCQEAGINFKVTFANLNHRFFDFIQIALVPSALKPPEKSFFLLHPIRILVCSRGGKKDEIAMRAFEISLSRL